MKCVHIIHEQTLYENHKKMIKVFLEFSGLVMWALCFDDEARQILSPGLETKSLYHVYCIYNYEQECHISDVFPGAIKSFGSLQHQTFSPRNPAMNDYFSAGIWVEFLHDRKNLKTSVLMWMEAFIQSTARILCYWDWSVFTFDK